MSHTMFLVRHLGFALFVSCCWAQTIEDALHNNAQISAFAQLILNSTTFFPILNSSTSFTLLAPTNNALAKYLAAPAPPNSNNNSKDWIGAVLSYHLLQGSHTTTSFSNESQFLPTYLTNLTSGFDRVNGGQRVEAFVDQTGRTVFRGNNKTTATVTFGDNLVINGTIHIIDTVLAIPEDILTVSADASLTYFLTVMNDIQVEPSYNPFVALNISTGVDNTVFAFNSPASLSAFHSRANNTNVTQLLEYHVIYGRSLYSPMLTDGLMLTTMAGLPAKVTVGNNGSVYINSARVITKDYLLFNGVLHVLDSMLIPGNTTTPDFTPVTSPTPSPTASTKKHKSSGVAIGAGLGVGLVALLALAALATYFVLKRRKTTDQIAPMGEVHSQGTHTTELDGRRTTPTAEMEDKKKDSERAELEADKNDRERAELPAMTTTYRAELA